MKLSSEAGQQVRLWFNYWLEGESALSTLKLTDVTVFPWGLQFKTTRTLKPGIRLHLRLLLPPMTAIVANGVIASSEHVSPTNADQTVVVQFTGIQETDRRRLAAFASGQRVVRLRANSQKGPLPPKNLSVSEGKIKKDRSQVWSRSTKP